MNTVEQRIAKAAIKGLLESGLSLTVDNGEETVLERSTDTEAILGAMFSTDEDTLYPYRGDEPSGFVMLVYGNDGWDVISDYSTGLDDALSVANRLADELSGD